MDEERRIYTIKAEGTKGVNKYLTKDKEWTIVYKEAALFTWKEAKRLADVLDRIAQEEKKKWRPNRVRATRKAGMTGFRLKPGEEHYNAKLTVDQVREIRSRIRDSKTLPRGRRSTLSDLAREYGVSVHTISLIKRRKLWKHVP